MFVLGQGLLDLAVCFRLRKGVCQSLVLLLVLRLLLGHLLFDSIGVESNLWHLPLHCVLVKWLLALGSKMLLDLAIVADKADLSVHLGKVDQVQVLLELVSLLGLDLALHVDQGDVSILQQLPLLLLIGLDDDFVLAVDHLGPVHLVIELVWVSEFCLQAQLLYSQQRRVMALIA